MPFVHLGAKKTQIFGIGVPELFFFFLCDKTNHLSTHEKDSADEAVTGSAVVEPISLRSVWLVG